MGTRSETVINFPYSGDYKIDVLLSPPDWRWTTTGKGISLPFSFMVPEIVDAAMAGADGLFSFNATQRDAVRQILDQISQCINVSFVELDQASNTQALLRFVNSTKLEGDGETDASAPEFATVYIDGTSKYNLREVEPGTYSWSTLIHEIGHALGLKHPGDYNGADGETNAPGNYLASVEDSQLNTVMSYTLSPQWLEREFFGKFDLQALRYLFGTREAHTGDDAYTYQDSAGTMLSLLIDDDGNDTIDVSALSTGTTIDLRPGGASSIGLTADGIPALDNISIAYSAQIENVIGSEYGDRIMASNSNNLIDAKGGIDTVIVLGDYKQFTVNREIDKTSNPVIRIIDSVVPMSLDILTSVEILQFDDLRIDFSMSELLSQVGINHFRAVSEFYLTYFNRIPDAEGMRYWLSEIQEGKSISDINSYFYAAASDDIWREFTGFSASMSDQDFVRLVYRNALGRSEVDAEGLLYWTNELHQTRNSGVPKAHENLVSSILTSAKTFKDDAEFGWVVNLMENKLLVSAYFSIEKGLSFVTPEDSLNFCIEVADTITATNTKMAIELIGQHILNT